MKQEAQAEIHTHCWVYILECRDGTLYTGWTNDLQGRLLAHNGGIGAGAKYTRGRRPVRLAYCEELETKSAALKREIAIKKLHRKKKLLLIEEQGEKATKR